MRPPAPPASAHQIVPEGDGIRDILAGPRLTELVDLGEGAPVVMVTPLRFVPLHALHQRRDQLAERDPMSIHNGLLAPGAQRNHG